MAYICEKGTCKKCKHYRYDTDRQRMACFAQTDEKSAGDSASTYNGKRVYTSRDFDYYSAKIGDYVDEGLVMDAINALPPVCMRSDCMQMGEPYSHRENPDTGEWKATYATFRRIDGNVWQYCGHCFRGENVERGKAPVYVGRVSRHV